MVTSLERREGGEHYERLRAALLVIAENEKKRISDVRLFRLLTELEREHLRVYQQSLTPSARRRLMQEFRATHSKDVE